MSGIETGFNNVLLVNDEAKKCHLKEIVPVGVCEDKQVGVLRSKISIIIQTKQIYKVWLGRSRQQAEFDKQLEENKGKKINSVMGVPRFFQLVTALEMAVKRDDPFADYIFYKIHQAINFERQEVSAQIEKLDEYIKDRIPAGMSMTKNHSISPVKIDLAINTKLGFLLVYLTLEIDELVRMILLAKQCSLISVSNASDATFKASKRIRRVMSLVHQFKYSGVTRDDISVNNARAQVAYELMSTIELPEEFLKATIRSPLAPAILSRVDVI
ncbi:PFL_4669 family integrating conjugative element protein [Motilimonas cestriensis]|uniref:PFL_4669 family integrating conjugative element protein n=1 Tax=Motilimonas cestriensis TaxID=2742685 RepID=UPI003DA3A61D